MNDPGEDFNVRQIHGAIVREYRLPGENKLWVSRRMRIFYTAIVLIGIMYVVAHSTGWDWEQYDWDPQIAMKHQPHEGASRH